MAKQICTSVATCGINTFKVFFRGKINKQEQMKHQLINSSSLMIK